MFKVHRAVIYFAFIERCLYLRERERTLIFLWILFLIVYIILMEENPTSHIEIIMNPTNQIIMNVLFRGLMTFLIVLKNLKNPLVTIGYTQIVLFMRGVANIQTNLKCNCQTMYFCEKHAWGHRISSRIKRTLRDHQRKNLTYLSPTS